MATIERGKAGTGSVLSLDAIGKQDTYLTSNNNNDSFFNYENIRHSDFAMFERVRSVPTENTEFWPFGKSITMTYKPTEMSDLLANMYLILTLPQLQGETIGAFYTDQIGRAIIEKIEFRVDEFVLETIENDWDVLHDELYTTNEDKKGLKNIINAGFDYSQLQNNPYENSKRIPLMIPLNMFFSRKHAFDSTLVDNYYKPYFPVCSITKQEIKVTVTFRPYAFFSAWQTDTSSLTVDFVDFVTQEIQLSDQERHFLQQHSFEVVYETVKRNPVLDVSGSEREFKTFLVPGLPVKSIHWFLRKSKYELVSTDMGNEENKNNIKNRFNFGLSETSNIYLEQYNPIISDAKIFLNGEEILGFAENSTIRNKNDSSNFHKYVQIQKTKLSSPIRNIYSFTFALNPKEHYPTGALDFSTIESEKSFIQCSFMNTVPLDEDFKFYLFFTGYQIINFANGFLSPKYSIY